MAANKEASIPQGSAPKLLDISELKQKFGVPESIFQGVIAAENWKPGRQVAPADFEAAIKRFCDSPIKRQVKKNA